MTKTGKKSKMGNTLRFVWIVAGVLMTGLLIQTILLLLTIQEYFP